MKKLLFICNVDWFFISHRLPIALQAIKDGWDVYLATGVTDKKDYLEGVGLKVYDVPIKRSSVSLLDELRLFHSLNKVVKLVRPDVVHSITIKCVIYGGLISRIHKIEKKVASISGLGYTFIEQSYKARVLRIIVKVLYKLALCPSTKVIFQNESDKSIFVDNRLIASYQCLLIRGSGVDLNKFQYKPEPNSLKTVIFLARLLKDKGLIEFCTAAETLQNKVKARFVLVGELDPENPNSITKVELSRYIDEGIVEHWGYSRNVESVIHMSHIMVLPSYREGLPKSLLEAAACGRAVITTDVPGCRDAIEKNKTGLLVKVKSSDELVKAILKLLSDDSLRISFGKAGRQLAEESFNIDDVVATHMTIYRG